MEPNNNKIGFVAWGLKLGYQVFFHSGNIRVDIPPVSSAIRDIRGVVNFSHPGQSFYSLEFTEVHRIYTAYYTIYDWANRDGAYFAISLLVPHGISGEKGQILGLLDELSDTYKRLYLDVTTNQIRRQQENPTLFLEIINRYMFSQTPLYVQGGITGNPTGRLSHVVFPDKELLRHYFDDSYRNEFRNFKQIFFIPEVASRQGILGMDGSSTALPFKPLIERYNIDLVFSSRNNQYVKDIEYRVFINGILASSAQGKISGVCKDDSIRVTGGSGVYEAFDHTTSISQLQSNQGLDFRWNITLFSKKFPALISITNEHNYPIPNALVSVNGFQYKSNNNGCVLCSQLFEPGASIDVYAGQKGYRDVMTRLELRKFVSEGILGGESIRLVRSPEVPGYRYNHSASSSRENKIRLFMLGVIVLLLAVVFALIVIILFPKRPPRGSKSTGTETTAVTPNAVNSVKEKEIDHDSIFLEDKILFNDSTYLRNITDILDRNEKIDTSSWKYKRASLIIEVLEIVPDTSKIDYIHQKKLRDLFRSKIWSEADKNNHKPPKIINKDQSDQLEKIFGPQK
jgi:hypothetical protein